MAPATNSEIVVTVEDSNEGTMAEVMIDTVTDHNTVMAPAMNSEIVLTVDDPKDSEAAMAEDMNHNPAAVYPEVDLTATQVPPMVEHGLLVNLTMDIGTEITKGSSAEIAMSEDWSMDLAATLGRDNRPSQFLVPYASLPSAICDWQGLTTDDDLDDSDQLMAEVS